MVIDIYLATQIVKCNILEGIESSNPEIIIHKYIKLLHLSLQVLCINNLKICEYL